MCVFAPFHDTDDDVDDIHDMRGFIVVNLNGAFFQFFSRLPLTCHRIYRIFKMGMKEKETA